MSRREKLICSRKLAEQSSGMGPRKKSSAIAGLARDDLAVLQSTLQTIDQVVVNPGGQHSSRLEGSGLGGAPKPTWAPKASRPRPVAPKLVQGPQGTLA